MNRLLLVCLGLIVAYFLLLGGQSDFRTGKAAPEIETQRLNGDKVKLSELRGKVVVLDFWATWCPPCRAMIPHERELVTRFQHKPFVFISIDIDGNKEALTKFLATTPMPWAHWLNDGRGGISREWGVSAVPTLFVIDAKGVVRKKIVGGDEKTLDDTVEKLVKEAEAANK